MTVRKTLTSIVLAAVIGLSGCKDRNQTEKPKQDTFPYVQAGQIAEIEPDAETIYGNLGLAAADFDGDGDIDLAVVRGKKDRGKVFLYKNDGQGKYYLAGQIAEIEPDAETIYGNLGLAAADFDGDGDIDLAVVRGKKDRGKVILYRNDGGSEWIRAIGR